MAVKIIKEDTNKYKKLKDKLDSMVDFSKPDIYWQIERAREQIIKIGFDETSADSLIDMWLHSRLK